MTDTCNSSALLSLVTVGHVDHGKSTLIGRLLADTDSLPEGKLEQVRNFCERNARPFEYAFLLDTLKDEQAQGITIDTTRIFFKTKKRRYMILDAPGHIEFLKNMVAGAAKADAALLLIDANEGIQENSKRHGILLSMLGIKQFVVVVNKMDLVGFSETRFREIETTYRAFLEKLGVAPLAFVPVSAFLGHNLTSPDKTNMPWYPGKTLLEMIDAFQAAPNLDELPFRLPVQDIYKFTKSGDARRIVVGTVASGTASVGQEVTFSPSGKKAKIRSIENFGTVAKTKMVAGEAVGFCLDQQLYLKRGEIAHLSEQKPIQVVSRLKASLFWLGRNPMVKGKRYPFKLGTERCEAELVELGNVLNSELNVLANAESIGTNETGECTIDLDHSIAVDLSEAGVNLNRFVLFDGFEAAGGGLIREVLEDPHYSIKAEVAERELKWDNSLVLASERTKRNGHAGALILISGNPSAPRKEIAKTLEKNLFESGHAVYYLGFGNLLSGIAAGLKRNQSAEQIRMVSEVAQVFVDSGTILIVSMQDLSQEDFQVMRMHLRGSPARAIWIGDASETDLKADQTILSHDSEIAVTEILSQLGSILKNNEG